jgi:hypothetical protein
MEKEPAPFATPGVNHQGVGHASMADNLLARLMENQRKIVIVLSGQLL